MNRNRSDDESQEQDWETWMQEPITKKRRLVEDYDSQEDDSQVVPLEGTTESQGLTLENMEIEQRQEEPGSSSSSLPPSPAEKLKKVQRRIKPIDSDSDESIAPTEILGEEEARSVGGESKAESSRSSGRASFGGDDDDDLLSIGSNNDEANDKAVDSDYDSDETIFEGPEVTVVIKDQPQPKSGTMRDLKKEEPRAGTSSSFLSQDDIRQFTSLVSTVTADDDEVSIISNDSDTTFDPTEMGFDGGSESESEDGEVQLKGKKKTGIDQSGSRRKSIHIPLQDNHQDSEDGENPIPVPLKDRPEVKVEPDFVFNDDVLSGFSQNSPHMYNPQEVKNEDWHGDVQRTVRMLSETLEQMPTPDDEDAEDIKLPPGLVELYPHQKYALRWMSWREGQFPGGGILADEMGLGKTIQVIALIMKYKLDAGGERMVTIEEAGRCLPSSTTLIVAPLGCIPQWVREIETKGKNLKVNVYHGTKKLASAIELSKFDVVITTYQTIGKEIPKPDPEGKPVRCYSPLKRLYWLRVVLDEGHVIRNPKTNAAMVISQLEARHRWAVTGTPIHNRPEDFFSMCKFLRLNPFDERSLWDSWIGLKNVKRGAEERLHVLGKALILRRTKEEVGISSKGKIQAIPPKKVEIITVELTAEERLVYERLMEYAKNVLREFLSQKELRKQGLRETALMYAGKKVQEKREEVPGDIRFSHIFALLVRLRQLAVLPYLVHTMLTEDEILEGDFDENKPEHIYSTKNPIFAQDYISSKYQKILEDVDELRAKAEKAGQPMDKIIIVSSWTTTLDTLHFHLMARKYCCLFITGREDMNLRMENMDRFNRSNSRPRILLLSLMAGGVGLNLTGANHVFFIEPHWNPQHELQAQDRVHRYGQTKNVFIRRYIAEETIESRIMGLQDYKLELADGLLKNTKKTRGGGITLEQIKLLFDLSRPAPPPPPSTSNSKWSAKAGSRAGYYFNHSNNNSDTDYSEHSDY